MPAVWSIASPSLVLPPPSAAHALPSASAETCRKPSALAVIFFIFFAIGSVPYTSAPRPPCAATISSNFLSALPAFDPGRCPHFAGYIKAQLSAALRQMTDGRHRAWTGVSVPAEPALDTPAPDGESTLLDTVADPAAPVEAVVMARLSPGDARRRYAAMRLALTPGQRRVVAALIHFRGDARRAAEALGIAPSTLRKAVTRIRRRLQQT